MCSGSRGSVELGQKHSGATRATVQPVCRATAQSATQRERTRKRGERRKAERNVKSACMAKTK